MDELDILKKDWQKETVNYPKVSANEIYPMLLKKSSSIVKLIFYISIAELMFWILMNSLPFLSKSYRDNFDQMQMSDAMFYGLNIFSYGIICVFIYYLYKSYRSISVVDNARELMENILRTRKIVKYYVIFNLSFLAVSSLIVLYFTMRNTPEIAEQIAALEPGTETTMFWLLNIGVFTLAILIFGVIFWLFYRLIYGILLKRLNKNYKELKKLEV